MSTGARRVSSASSTAATSAASPTTRRTSRSTRPKRPWCTHHGGYPLGQRLAAPPTKRARRVRFTRYLLCSALPNVRGSRREVSQRGEPACVHDGVGCLGTVDREESRERERCQCWTHAARSRRAVIRGKLRTGCSCRCCVMCAEPEDLKTKRKREAKVEGAPPPAGSQALSRTFLTGRQALALYCGWRRRQWLIIIIISVRLRRQPGHAGLEPTRAQHAQLREHFVHQCAVRDALVHLGEDRGLI